MMVFQAVQCLCSDVVRSLGVTPLMTLLETVYESFRAIVSQGEGTHDGPSLPLTAVIVVTTSALHAVVECERDIEGH